VQWTKFANKSDAILLLYSRFNKGFFFRKAGNEYPCHTVQQHRRTESSSHYCNWPAQRGWWVTGHKQGRVGVPQSEPLPRSTADSTASNSTFRKEKIYPI